MYKKIMRYYLYDIYKHIDKDLYVTEIADQDRLKRVSAGSLDDIKSVAYRAFAASQECFRKTYENMHCFNPANIY